MIWLQFIGSAILVIIAAIKLAEYGDVIALRTRLGGLFIGTVLLAAATSLPELLTTISAINQMAPNLAVGNIFGSSMFNMFMLGVLDIFYQQARILRQVAISHALSGSLAVLLTALAVFFIQANIDLQVGWVGVDSLLLIGLYLYGLRLINNNNHQGSPESEAADEGKEGLPSLKFASTGFFIATIVLLITAPWLVRSSVGIAEITGLSTGFIGVTLVATVTSLPEVVTTIAAVRLKAYNLAVGNLFGSNIFNIFALGLADLFFLPGRLLSTVDPALMLAGLIALLLTGIGLIGNLAREERRLLFVEIDALLILVGYTIGLWLLYDRGIVF